MAAEDGGCAAGISLKVPPLGQIVGTGMAAGDPTGASCSWGGLIQPGKLIQLSLGGQLGAGASCLL